MKSPRAFRLEGSSMLPLFKPGEIVLVDENVRGRPPVLRALRSSSRNIRPGDCVVYRRAGRLLLHRVLSADSDGLLISDDAGRIAPHHVPLPDVAGRVITSDPLKKGLTGLFYSKTRRLAGRLLS